MGRTVSLESHDDHVSLASAANVGLCAWGLVKALGRAGVEARAQNESEVLSRKFQLQLATEEMMGRLNKRALDECGGKKLK